MSPGSPAVRNSTWARIRVRARLKSLRLELAFGDSGLADDSLECTSSKLGMIRYRDSNCCTGQPLLHHDMATALANFNEAVPRENGTNLFAREYPEFTQRRYPYGLHTLRHGGDV